MKVFLSHPWGPSCPPYANGLPVSFEPTKAIACGDSCNSLHISAPNHIGTHFDFPLHFCAGGKAADQYPAAAFCHEQVALIWISLSWGDILTAERLREEFKNSAPNPAATLVLIRTGAAAGRQSEEFWAKSPGLGQGLAPVIREAMPLCQTIGIDSISISSLLNRDLGRVVHRELLCQENPFLLIEDMNLEALKGTCPKSVWALPLRIEGGDGAPCTVVAEI